MLGFINKLLAKAWTIENTARELIARMQALRPGNEYTFQPDIGVLKTSDGGVIGLSNLHTDLARVSAGERAQTLDTFARGMP